MLRASAERALRGHIPPQVRRIAVDYVAGAILFSVTSAVPLDMDACDALTTATAEIISDFPDHDLREIWTVSTQPLPDEPAIWIFTRDG